MVKYSFAFNFKLNKMKNFFGIFFTSFVSALLVLGVYTYFIEEPIEKTITIKEELPALRVSGTTPIYNSPDLVVAAERTLDAVVHVKTSFFDTYTDFFDPFDFDFFWGFGQGNKKQREPHKRNASGSGVIITSDGYIVTNNHVVEKAEEIEIVLNDKRTYQAEIVGTDPASDLALLKINDINLPYVISTNSDNVKVGEWVLAVGNPFNLNSTVTAGIVSAKGRNINIINDKYAIESFIQTDAAVNPGNSGGALVNVNGELIGINTAISTQTGTFEGYSFAVPSNLVKKVVDDLLEFGTVQRAFLGVTIRDVSAELAEEFELNNLKGVYVDDVSEEGAAKKAGIKKGDIILSVNEVKVSKSSELQEQISQYRPGDRVAVRISRDNKEKEIILELKNKKGDTSLIKKEEENIAKSLGAEFQDLDKTELEKLGIDHGVKVINIQSGKLMRAGIREGFIITSINNQLTKSVKNILNILNSLDGGVYIEGIYRKNGVKHYYAFGL